MSHKDPRCDAELHRDALDGGPERFAPIVRRYQDAVFGVALARLRDFHAAEDVAQQVFVDAFQRLGGLKDPSRLGAWLRAIAIHKCIDRVRRPSGQAANWDQRVSDQPRPDQTAQRRELRQRVLAAIGRLSDAQRETTTLFYIDGYSVQDVAAMQAVPSGTVKRRLHDARERLKEQLIDMVEDVLKSEAPKEDFAQRVFELLCSFHPRDNQTPLPWGQTVAELRGIGAEGIEGFVRALGSAHSPTRAMAAHMLQQHHAPQGSDIIADVLKKALSDPNRKVRRLAVEALMRFHIDDETKRREFGPLTVGLLADRSKRVRRAAAWELRDWAADVPIEPVARSLLDEKDAETLKRLRGLLGAVLNAREDRRLE